LALGMGFSRSLLEDLLEVCPFAVGTFPFAVRYEPDVAGGLGLPRSAEGGLVVRLRSEEGAVVREEVETLWRSEPRDEELELRDEVLGRSLEEERDERRRSEGDRRSADGGR